MDWIFVVIYAVVAIVLSFIYEKIFPYEEDITLGYSDRYQRKQYYSMMAIGVVFWPLLLTAFVIRWAIDFVNWLFKRKKDG